MSGDDALTLPNVPALHLPSASPLLVSSFPFLTVFGEYLDMGRLGDMEIRHREDLLCSYGHYSIICAASSLFPDRSIVPFLYVDRFVNGGGKQKYALLPHSRSIPGQMLTTVSRPEWNLLPMLSDPHIIRLGEAMEVGGTINIAMADGRLTILPSRRSTDGNVMWAETVVNQSDFASFAIHEFPIVLFSKLLRGGFVEGEYSVYVSQAKVCIRNRDGSVMVECDGAKCSNLPSSLLNCIPRDVSAPDICLKIADDPACLARLHGRLARLRRCTESVLVSGNGSGRLIFSLSNANLSSYSVEWNGLDVIDSTCKDDPYKTFGVQVSLKTLLRVLRVAGCGIEQLQVAIVNGQLLLFIISTKFARFTAIIPHFDAQ